MNLRAAAFPADRAVVEALFREYAASLDVDLSFQDFASEVDALPGKYAEPRGTLLVAWRDGTALGCVGLRPIDATTCEMKRLYVRPAARGLNLGRTLVARLLEEARGRGYTRICLDTLPSMSAAQGLYASFGFREIAPYVFNPVVGTRFMARELGATLD